MKRLALNQSDKKLLGVCSGLARYFDMDVTLVRLIVVFLTISTGMLPGIFSYVIAALIMPKEGDVSNA
jgi:phage shock protein C